MDNDASEGKSEWCDDMLDNSMDVREERIEVVLHVYEIRNVRNEAVVKCRATAGEGERLIRASKAGLAIACMVSRVSSA